MKIYHGNKSVVNIYFLLIPVAACLFGFVVSICSICVVKQMKMLS